LEKLKINTHERICSIKKQATFLFDKRMERHPGVLGSCAGDRGSDECVEVKHEPISWRYWAHK